MINEKYPDYHSSIQKKLDYFPVISMGSSLSHIVKAIKKQISKISKNKIDGSIPSSLRRKKVKYYSKRQLNHIARAILGLIPIVGNIVMFIYDKHLKRVNVPKAQLRFENKIESLKDSINKDFNSAFEVFKTKIDQINTAKITEWNVLNRVQDLIGYKLELNHLFKTLFSMKIEKEIGLLKLEELYSIQEKLYSQFLECLDCMPSKSLVELIIENEFMKLRLLESEIGPDLVVERLKIDQSIEEHKSLLSIYEKAKLKHRLRPEEDITVTNHLKILEGEMRTLKALKNDLMN